MKRRTFVTGLGAAGLCAPWIIAGGDPLVQPAIRPLVPIFDRLPEALAAPPSKTGKPLRYPLVIGLGEAAQRMVDQARTCPLLPLDAGLYRTGAATAPGATDWLARRLESCYSALLLVDTADPQALAEGPHWARQLAEHEVTLRVAVLLNATGPWEPRGWRAAMRASLEGVIEVWTRGATLGADQTVQFLLQSVPFLRSGLIGYNSGGIRVVLSNGPEARTTAVRWEHEPILPAALANACGPLDPTGCKAAVLWVHTGRDFTIGELHMLHQQCDRLLPTNTDRLIAVMDRPDWAKPRRVLSLTLVGDWSGTRPVGTSADA